MLFSLLSLLGCSTKVDRLPFDLLSSSKQDPALSGDGRKLALIIDKNGRPTVQLREIDDGKILPLRHLLIHQPHSSPSLSWSGRYLAVIAQIGNRRLVILEDRLKGRMHRFSIPGGRLPERISLSPDARRLAIQILQRGKWHVEFFDISNRIEPDNTIR